MYTFEPFTNLNESLSQDLHTKDFFRFSSPNTSIPITFDSTSNDYLVVEPRVVTSRGFKNNRILILTHNMIPFQI